MASHVRSLGRINIFAQHVLRKDDVASLASKLTSPPQHSFKSDPSPFPMRSVTIFITMILP
jgi:hypothetical protein